MHGLVHVDCGVVSALDGVGVDVVWLCSEKGKQRQGMRLLAGRFSCRGSALGLAGSSIALSSFRSPALLQAQMRQGPRTARPL